MPALRRLLLATAVALMVTAAPAHAAPRTVIFNLTASPLDRPDRIFFQANSGPYLKDLVWTGWGTAKAVGTGTYVLDCSSGGSACGADTGVTTYPARYTLTGLAACPRFGTTAKTYLRGVVETDRPAGTKVSTFSPDGDGCGKRPSRAAAARAVVRYIRRHHPATKVAASCRTTGATDLECRGRWTQKGKRRTNLFFVFARRVGPPSVSERG